MNKIDIKELIDQRSESFCQLYDLLIPIIKDRIGQGESQTLNIRKLYTSLNKEFGIHEYDFSLIINQMIENKIIHKEMGMIDFGLLSVC